MTFDRYYYIIFFGLCFSMIWSSCSNDFEVNADEKDIPIVFGFLSLSETEQYIRVERAFIEDDVSALELAQREGEIYYDSGVTVSITNTRSGEVFPLERIDAAALGIPRDEGLFLTDPNILYSIPLDDLQLNQNDTYQLNIERGGEFDVVTATTPIVGQMELKSPIPIIGGPRSITIIPSRIIRLSLENNPANAALYDAVFIVNYQERLADGTSTSNAIEWNVLSNVSNLEDVVIPGLEFYSFLAGAFSSTPDGITRRITGIDVKIVAGASAFADYQRIINANSGITGAEDAIPTFTNLSEGLGIFSSRNQLIERDFSLTGESIDSILTNELTRGLNFVR